MNDIVRQKLRDLVLEFGNSLYEDPRLCEGLLKDYCGIYKWEVNVLIGALKEQVVVTLLSSPNIPYDIVSGMLEKRLRDNLALSEESAHWAVESWAIALQISKSTSSNVVSNSVYQKEDINTTDSAKAKINQNTENRLTKNDENSTPDETVVKRKAFVEFFGDFGLAWTNFRFHFDEWHKKRRERRETNKKEATERKNYQSLSGTREKILTSPQDTHPPTKRDAITHTSYKTEFEEVKQPNEPQSLENHILPSTDLLTHATPLIEQKDEEDLLNFPLDPSRLSEYIGQKKVKDNLRVFMKAALIRREALDHILLLGPEGVGKRTLAAITAMEMGAELKSTTAHTIEKAGDLAALLTNLAEGDTLFIDEIHRLKPRIKEVLFPAMKDYNLDLMIAQRSIKLELAKFTVIGATTRPDLITKPLLGLFGIVFNLDAYMVEELQTIIQRTARILNIEINEKGAKEIAERSNGIPKTANRLLLRVRDFAEVEYDGLITEEVAKDALNRIEIDI